MVSVSPVTRSASFAWCGRTSRMACRRVPLPASRHVAWARAQDERGGPGGDTGDESRRTVVREDVRPPPAMRKRRRLQPAWWRRRSARRPPCPRATLQVPAAPSSRPSQTTGAARWHPRPRLEARLVRWHHCHPAHAHGARREARGSGASAAMQHNLPVCSGACPHGGRTPGVVPMNRSMSSDRYPLGRPRL
jgi:hypothetical protein